MSENIAQRKAVVDWLTTIAIAAIAVSMMVAFHEGVHALSCIVLGGDLQEYSALHVTCNYAQDWQSKIGSGSASVANIILGTVFLFVLRRSQQKSSEWLYFAWLFMLVNWLNGAGYWMFSGIANLGDWANVIDGWNPAWLWRVTMTFVGVGSYLFFVWLALKEFGKIVGGNADEQIGRATKLGIISYVRAVFIIFLAGLAHPYGMGSLPVVAGLLAVMGGLSPLLWMMQWFRAASFAKLAKPPLEIHRKLSWVVVAAVVVFVYVVILGRTLYF